MSETSLETRFLQNLADLAIDGSRPVIVAFSGGLDSTVLLHLLRFGVLPRLQLVAAHFDHRMRPDSGEDAAWARGLCRAWDVPIERSQAAERIRSEADARRARYDFLFEVARTLGAPTILTAHHADDQAETVLFRVLRGTGVAGLRGIPQRGRSGIVRPLLPFWREELEAYAAGARVRWRSDTTNETLGPVRNRIRLKLLPEIERTIAPGARRNLVALAALARESEAGWHAVVREARRDCVRQESGAPVLVRSRLAEYHPAIAKGVIRDVLRRQGIVLDRVGTRSALQFITDASSGREMHLPGGVRIRVEFDHARIERETSAAEGDAPVTIPELTPGCAQTAHLRLGGRDYRVDARHESGPSPEADRDAIWKVRIALSALRFPLLLRSRRPGDRVRTAGGTKSLKKLFIERRIPLGERATRPILVDAEDAVVWIAGIGCFVASPSPRDAALNLAVYDE